MRRSTTTLLLTVLAFATLSTATPRDASAIFGVGAEGIWVPYSNDNVTPTADSTSMALANDEEASHGLNSLGGSLYLTLGIDLFSLGLKANLINHGYTSGPIDSFVQVDTNLTAQIGLPFMPLTVWAEGGGSFSTKIGGLGYNVGGGLRYTVVDIPLLEPYIGLGGSYTKLVHKTEDVEVDVSGLRLLVSLGLRISL